MKDEILRTFFGFELPREVSRRAAALRTLVNDPKRAVRWVKGENIHLTIRFLGSTPRPVVEQIAAALPDRLIGWSPLAVTIEGTGVFPAPSRPRVIWMGVGGEVPRLQELEALIHEVVEPMGFPREEREFHPHITLGRVRYPQKITPDVTAFLNAEYEPVVCPLKALHLYQSLMEDRGVRYIPLATIPFEANRP